MPGPAERPLLFLDIDGPLIPFGSTSRAYPAEHPDHGAGAAEPGQNPLLARLDPEHGSRLMGLPCELVWATTWMDDANEIVAPRLGLPRLAVVDWPEPSDGEEERDARLGLHWKTRALVDRAAGRSFVWVDDEITDRDRVWVSAHHQGRALLHRVDSRRGLTGADFAALRTWLAGEPVN